MHVDHIDRATADRQRADSTITHDRQALSILMLTSRRNADGAYRRLKLDQGMGLVMRVSRTGFTVGAEVDVIADGALVADAADIP